MILRDRKITYMNLDFFCEDDKEARNFRFLSYGMISSYFLQPDIYFYDFNDVAHTSHVEYYLNIAGMESEIILWDFFTWKLKQIWIISILEDFKTPKKCIQEGKGLESKPFNLLGLKYPRFRVTLTCMTVMKLPLPCNRRQVTLALMAIRRQPYRRIKVESDWHYINFEQIAVLWIFLANNQTSIPWNTPLHISMLMQSMIHGRR